MSGIFPNRDLILLLVHVFACLLHLPLTLFLQLQSLGKSQSVTKYTWSALRYHLFLAFFLGKFCVLLEMVNLSLFNNPAKFEEDVFHLLLDDLSV